MMSPADGRSTASKNRSQHNKRHLLRYLLLIGLDVLAMVIAFLGAFSLRYSYNEWGLQFARALPFLPIVIAVGLLIFMLTGMYRTLWRYASVYTAIIIGYSTFLAAVVPAAIMIVWGPFASHWAVFVIQWLLLILMVSSGRFSIRIVREFGTPRQSENKRRLIIYGAGDAGDMIARDLLRATWHDFRLVGFIDDNPDKHGRSIHGVSILGGREKVASVVEEKKVDEIIVAMPSLSGSQMRSILNYLHSNLNGQVHLKTAPGITELIDGTVSLQQVRHFDVRDLLRRSPVELETDCVDNLLRNKCVLVSGAGGSIGSEICRQALHFSPSKLVLMDVSEFSLYNILEELMEKFPNQEFVSVVGNVAHKQLVNKIFTSHSPEIVFHAAAYKHVPLMERNPWSAVNNNVSGTRILAQSAADHLVERFVMISTDKAVRPSSVMGATKRICEMLIQVQPHSSDSIFCSVRFGNVMGSSGSVIPKFERQIKAGGPVTVTDPNVTRYFMLTSEAVQLVMQAATLNHNDAIYILDMGEPVKIADIAREIILLSGLEPGNQIKIEYIGLQPGEKLREELYHTGFVQPTEIDKIGVAEAPPCNNDEFIEEIDELLSKCYSLNYDELLSAISKLVPDYSGNSHHSGDSVIKGSNFLSNGFQTEVTAVPNRKKLLLKKSQPE